MIAAAHADDAEALVPRPATALQRLLQAKQLDAAAALAERCVPDIGGDARLALLVLLTFERTGQQARVLTYSLSNIGAFASVEIAAVAMRAARLATDDEKHVVATRALATGLGTAPVHTMLGLAHAARHEAAAATLHLRQAAALGPLSLRAASILGDLLLVAGNARDALPHLKRAVELAPDMPSLRAGLARAHRMLRDFDSAATEYCAVAALAPGSDRWSRAAIGALNQVGRIDEADTLFRATSARRDARLPDDFASGLDALWHDTGRAQIPAARLDWAWRFRDLRNPIDRPNWEKRARWGHLADLFMLDWLECRTARAGEAMQRLADIDSYATASGRLHARGRGLVITSAHIGAMYAGPMILELLDYRSKWLASASGVPAAAYRKSLISTTDQLESQVARQAMAGLASGDAVAIMADGAMSVAAPRIDFEGQSITYSAFAARVAHRYRAPSLFVVPQWRDGRIDLMWRILPDAEPGEPVEAYLPRWRTAYLAALREAMCCTPENLRLSGGIWRHIR